MQGDQLDHRNPVITHWQRTQKVSHGPFSTETFNIHTFEPVRNERSPLYPTSSEFTSIPVLYSAADFPLLGVKKSIELEADLSSISRTKIPIKTGEDGYDYYELSYEIKVAFFSAHLEFSLWYAGKEYGKVNAKWT